MSLHSASRRRIAFAMGGVLLLLGVAFAAAMWTGREAAAPEPVQSTADLSALSAPMPFDASGIAVAVPEQSLNGTFDLSANGTLSGAGFAIADAGQYAIGEHGAAIASSAGGQFFWHAMPSNATIQNVTVRTDTDADAALVEAESALAQFAALWASQDVQGLFDTVDATGAEHGVVVPGLVRSPLDAGHAAQPDDDAAALAQMHADGMLSVVDRGYGDLEAGLDRLEETQSGLPAQLHAAQQATNAFGAEAQAALDAQHQARLDAIAAQALAFEAEVQAAAQAHADAAVEAREAALAEVDGELAAQQLVLDDAVATAHAELDARLQAVHNESAARLGQIDASQDVQAAAEARASVEAQLAVAVQEAADAHAAIEAQASAAKAQLEEQAASVRGNVTAAAEAALAWGDQREAELLASIQGAVEAGIALESELHADTSAYLASLVEAQKHRLQAQALAAVQQARQEAETALALVEAVQQEAAAEVDHDLQVILAVAEDHRAVPTPEREAAAQAWMEVHGFLAGSLEQEIHDGVDVLVKAQAVLEAAAAAEAAIS